MVELRKDTIISNPNAKKIITDYWMKRSDSFSDLRSKELSSSKKILWTNELNKHISNDRRQKILDIGCGAGFFSIILAEQGHEVTGVDLTTSMIEQAQIQAKLNNVEVDFLVMDAERLLFDDEEFDIIVTRNVTWNLPNPSNAYQEWHRVLKKGGTLLNYDGEYAKDHHNSLARSGAHAELSDDVLEECHSIYHMLDISIYDRPVWDLRFLEEQCHMNCIVDLEVSNRIYQTKDIFYVAVPMFLIKGTK